MQFDLIKHLSGLNLFSKLKEYLPLLNEKNNKLYTSPLYGSTKSHLIRELSATENQIVVLLPEVKLISELSVELNLIGLEDSIISISDFNLDSIQEKLTQISHKKQFIICTTYQLLDLSLPSLDEIQKTTTQTQVGGEITYNDLIEYLKTL